jgi:hypothetical protein
LEPLYSAFSELAGLLRVINTGTQRGKSIILLRDDLSCKDREGGMEMILGDCKNVRQGGRTRRGFLKILAITGTVSSFDLLGAFKKMGFGKEGEVTPEEMREKAMQVFMKPKLFM